MLIHSFRYLFNQSLLSKCYVLGSVLGTNDTALHEVDETPAFSGFCSSNRLRPEQATISSERRNKAGQRGGQGCGHDGTALSAAEAGAGLRGG